MGPRYYRGMMPYERLDAWRQSHELVKLVYRVSRAWPRDERYGLTAQTRRAAYSIPMNIAEGTAKRGSREFRRFLDIAWGSYAELSYCLRLAGELGYLTPDDELLLEPQRVIVGKLTWKLHASMSKAAKRIDG